jgi:uracil-DNA glycosylase family 4
MIDFHAKLKELRLKKLGLVYGRAMQIKTAYLDNTSFHEPIGSPVAHLAIVCNCHPLKKTLNPGMLFLKHILTKQCGIGPDGAYITNAIKRDLVKPQGHMIAHAESRPVRHDEITQWREILLDELAIIQPRVVLCMGGNAAKVLFGDPQFAVTKERGKHLSAPACPYDIRATVSASYVHNNGAMRNKDFKQFMADILEAKQDSEVEPE